MPRLRGFAEKTKVPVIQSRRQLEDYLQRQGASGFASAWDTEGDTIEFLWKAGTTPTTNHYRVRFRLPRLRSGNEQEARRRWRALLLVVKAKVEAVRTGIAIFEEEFLAHIVDERTGCTVGQILVPRLKAREALALPPSPTTPEAGMHVHRSEFKP